MQVVVQDSTNANERAILIEGWNKLDPPTPIDISAVTLRVSNNGGTVANADGTTTRLDSSHVHRFVFADAAQFQAFAAGDVVALIVPDSATGDGRMGLSFPILVSAGNPGAAPQAVPTAADNANAVVAEAAAIANAVVEAEIDALETYNRTSNTAATITGPTSGAVTLTIATDAAYEPIKSIT
jgi:hypothetical protein